MPYRKIKYFSEKEAESLCDKLNGDNRRSNMVGSEYNTEKLPEGWVINHYVLGQLVSTKVKNGMMPYDYDQHYREGYIYYEKS